jgi:hypothetical protein
VSLRHGPPERGPWTYVIEEKYYHPRAVAYIWMRRREMRNEEQCRIFVNKTNLRIKGKMIQV